MANRAKGVINSELVITVNLHEPLQFRERKYPLHFDGNLEHALQRANCQKGLNRRGNRRMLKTKVTTERGKWALKALETLFINILYLLLL